MADGLGDAGEAEDGREVVRDDGDAVALRAGGAGEENEETVTVACFAQYFVSAELPSDGRRSRGRTLGPQERAEALLVDSLACEGRLNLVQLEKN